MLRWLGLGALWALATGLVWGYGVASAATDHAVAFTVVGVLWAAWIVPLWWIGETLVRAVLMGLKGLLAGLGTTEGEAAVMRARAEGTSWVMVATDWGLAYYDAPVVVRDMAPGAVTLLTPLFDQPMGVGVVELKANAQRRMAEWRRRLWAVRAAWAAACLGPLWLPALWWLATAG